MPRYCILIKRKMWFYFSVLIFPQSDVCVPTRHSLSGPAGSRQPGHISSHAGTISTREKQQQRAVETLLIFRRGVGRYDTSNRPHPPGGAINLPPPPNQRLEPLAAQVCSQSETRTVPCHPLPIPIPTRRYEPNPASMQLSSRHHFRVSPTHHPTRLHTPGIPAETIYQY